MEEFARKPGACFGRGTPEWRATGNTASNIGGQKMRNNRVATAIIASVLVSGLLGSGLTGCGYTDGPMGPIPGGELRSGTLVSEPNVEWSLADQQMIELQLVEPLRSRTTGAMLHEGQLYVGVDLGFIYRRIPLYHPARWMLSIIYRVKHWHEDALLDGRVVIRFSGKRYERQAVRVTDPETVAALRSKVEEGAAQVFSSLGEAPTDDPKDIWFFRMDPRPAT